MRKLWVISVSVILFAVVYSVDSARSVLAGQGSESHAKSSAWENLLTIPLKGFWGVNNRARAALPAEDSSLSNVFSSENLGAVGNPVPTSNPISPPVPVSGDSGEAISLWRAIRVATGIDDFNFNASLSTASSAHAQYVVATDEFSHIEVAGSPRFTGLSPCDRLLSVGYRGECLVELIASGGSPFSAFEQLMDGPFERFALLGRNFKDVGWGFDKGSYGVAVVNFGSYLKNTTADADVTVYPYPNQVEIPTLWLVNESPSPAPDLNLTYVGYPITFSALRTSKLLLSDVTVTDEAGNRVLGRLVSNYPSAKVPLEFAAIWFSYQPLAPGTTYTVDAVGSIQERGLVLNWKFTTVAAMAPKIQRSSPELVPGSSVTIDAIGGSGRASLVMSPPPGVLISTISNRRVIATRSATTPCGSQCTMSILMLDKGAVVGASSLVLP